MNCLTYSALHMLTVMQQWQLQLIVTVKMMFYKLCITLQILQVNRRRTLFVHKHTNAIGWLIGFQNMIHRRHDSWYACLWEFECPTRSYILLKFQRYHVSLDLIMFACQCYVIACVLDLIVLGFTCRLARAHATCIVCHMMWGQSRVWAHILHWGQCAFSMWIVFTLGLLVVGHVWDISWTNFDVRFQCCLPCLIVVSGVELVSCSICMHTGHIRCRHTCDTKSSTHEYQQWCLDGHYRKSIASPQCWW